MCDNVILIGMPGCGKTTIARALGKALGREVLDSDELICEKAGMPVPEIFAQWGEEGFRALETTALIALCKRSGCVISTGGGCVTREENRAILHEGGTVIWLRRDLNKLALSGRPLTRQKGVETLYAERKALYEEFARFTVDNNGTVDDTVRAICAQIS